MKYGKYILSGLLGAVILALLGAAGGNNVRECVIFGLFGAFASPMAYFLVLRNKAQKDRRMIDMDMADYLTSTALLLSSGLNLWDAMQRGMSGCDLKRPLYREIRRAFGLCESGMVRDRVTAFEMVGASLNVPSVSTLVCAIAQNYKKGSGELAELFMNIASDCRRERRDIAGKMADEASTLLLIPSVLVLIAMILMLAGPAVLELMKI